MVSCSLDRDYASRFERGDTALFCLRVMVGVIILYDHVHPLGAFVKNSNIDVSSLCERGGEQLPTCTVCIQ